MISFQLTKHPRNLHQSTELQHFHPLQLQRQQEPILFTQILSQKLQPQQFRQLPLQQLQPQPQLPQDLS